MHAAQKLVYAAFLGLLISTLVLSNSECVAAGAPGGVAPSASEIDPLVAGDRAPAFEVRTVDDEVFVFDPAALLRPVVLITFRGGWCPYCNMHLSELREVVPELAAMGVDVLFLSGDRPELLYSSLERETQDDIAGLGYRILSDADVNAARALGIAFRAADATIERYESRGTDIAGSSMKKARALPVPAVFVIDADGLIAFSFAEPDYKIRLPAGDVLEAAIRIAE